MKSIKKSWRTTLIGALLAISVAVQPLIETGVMDYRRLVLAALIALFGVLSKDAGVSGTGTTGEKGQ